MRAPDFWFSSPARPHPFARMLSPLAWCYAALTRRRLSQSGYRPTVPVICLGNINVGGTGKTPTAIALVERLIAQGRKPAVVSRGYGGRLAGPVLVDPKIHKADDVGDEPLLLSAFAPTYVAKDRAAGARKAEAGGAGVILLDDGFQNPSVEKDVNIVVVDALRGFGNGRVMPAGPLRETLDAGIARADYLLVIGPPAEQDRFAATWDFEKPVLTGHLAPLPTGMPWCDLRLMAFAGIGNPEKFFRTLRDLGATLVHTESLSDHQPLTDGLMRRLERDATAQNAQLVTTEKDAVRLPQTFKGKALTLPVRLQLTDWAPLDAALNQLFDTR